MRKALLIKGIIICTLFITTGCAIVSELETNTGTNIKHPDQIDPIYFTEDSSIAISDYLNQSLGAKRIVIQKGDYVIDFTENPNGRIEFRIDLEESDFEQTDSGPIYGISVAIRIAKRKSKHYSCNCCSGIGFRCGFVAVTTRFDSYPLFERSNPDQRTKYASVSINKIPGTISVDLLQKVNWEELGK